MNENQNDFLSECCKFHTTVAVFIRLFNLWSRLSSDERGGIIEHEIKNRRLEVE